MAGRVKQLEFINGVEVAAPLATSFQKAVIDDAVTWDGFTTTHDYDTSSFIADATKADWHIRNVALDYRVENVGITTPDANTVRVTVGTGMPLDAGTYRLIGIY